MAGAGEDTGPRTVSPRRLAWAAAAVVWVAAPLAVLLNSGPGAAPEVAAGAARPASAGPTVVHAATFDEAVQSFRSGRHADAYGRFVALANEGDRDAARIALFMHCHGERLFGSQWDASPEELAAWADNAAGSACTSSGNAGQAKTLLGRR